MHRWTVYMHYIIIIEGFYYDEITETIHAIATDWLVLFFYIYLLFNVYHDVYVYNK